MRNLFLAATLLLSLGLTGCMDFGMKLKIGEDGSSTMTMSLEMLDQLFQGMQAQMQQQGSGDMGMFDKASLETMVNQYNGEVKSFSNEVVDGKRKIDLSVYFPDGSKMNNLADGLIKFQRDGNGTTTLRFMEDSSVGMLKQTDREQLAGMLEMAKPSMIGLRWQIDFEVPDMQDTNLEREGNTASFVFDYDKDWADKTTAEMVDGVLGMVEPKWITFKSVD